MKQKCQARTHATWNHGTGHRLVLPAEETLSMELPTTAKDEEHLLDEVLALVAGASGHGLLAEAMLGKLPALAASGEVHELGDEGH